MNQDTVTIFDASGREFTGVPNVYLNEHKNTAEVYIGDDLIVIYSECDDAEEAVEMMLEDYGVTEEEYSL